MEGMFQYNGIFSGSYYTSYNNRHKEDTESFDITETYPLNVLSASCCHFSGYFMLGYTAL
jgi:hypothetical protein